MRLVIVVHLTLSIWASLSHIVSAPPIGTCSLEMGFLLAFFSLWHLPALILTHLALLALLTDYVVVLGIFKEHVHLSGAVAIHDGVASHEELYGLGFFLDDLLASGDLTLILLNQFDDPIIHNLKGGVV